MEISKKIFWNFIGFYICVTSTSKPSQVTQQNEDNQLYLVGESLGAARTFCALFRRCAGEARAAAPRLRAPLLDAALPAVKVLVNLSHSFSHNGQCFSPTLSNYRR